MRVRIDKTHSRNNKVFIRIHKTAIRIDIITNRIHIIIIRTDIITDRTGIFFDRKDKILIRIDKYSHRSKSGTYARHTKANTRNPTLHNSQSCPTLLGHTLIVGNRFRRIVQKGEQLTRGFVQVWLDGINLNNKSILNISSSLTECY